MQRQITKSFLSPSLSSTFLGNAITFVPNQSTPSGINLIFDESPTSRSPTLNYPPSYILALTWEKPRVTCRKTNHASNSLPEQVGGCLYRLGQFHVAKIDIKDFDATDSKLWAEAHAIRTLKRVLENFR